ncbi:hypothetical protein N7501_002916 [Penicillium viridicatum]|nr:hypothetical protein N7501_002916 [Penicillium viridicatum]
MWDFAIGKYHRPVASDTSEQEPERPKMTTTALVSGREQEAEDTSETLQGCALQPQMGPD